MRQSKSLNEAEIKAFTDQALFTKLPNLKGRMSLIVMWIMAGAIIGAVLTIGIFVILTRLSNNQMMIYWGYDPIKAVTFH